MDYNLETHLKTFIEKYGKKLKIGECELLVEDYEFKSPRVMFNAIQIPSQYLELIDYTSNLILTNKNIFPEIGDVSKEVNEPRTFTIQEKIFRVDDFIEVNNIDKSSFNYTPKDAKRQEFASMMKYFINSFILYHELGHVRQSSFNPEDQLSFDEDGNDDKKDAKLDEQSMEVDADIFAINSLCQDIFYAIDNFEKKGWTKNDILMSAMYSFFVFFYMSNNSDNIDDPSKGHPHPVVRFAILSNFMQRIFLDNELCKNIGEFNTLIQKVLSEFDKTLTHHFGSNHNKSYYDLFFSEDLKAVKDKIKNNIPKIPCLSFNRP